MLSTQGIRSAGSFVVRSGVRELLRAFMLGGSVRMTFFRKYELTQEFRRMDFTGIGSIF